MSYILSIDQGTTGSTAVIIELPSLKVLAKSNTEFQQIFPSPGLVEHNLHDIWDSVSYTINDVLRQSNIDPKEIKGIGITNQRETICAFNKDARPIRNAIVWQDRRTHEYCSQFSDDIKRKVKNLTGLPIDPYFSATKINWMIKNDQKVKDALKNNDCLFGTIDTYLLYKLTGSTSFKTEATNASRTLLFDINNSQWSDELCDLFKIPMSSLPEVGDSFRIFGETKDIGILPDGIPISGILGDQQAALFGQAGFEKGMSKCTYGTGAFYLTNTGKQKIESNNGLLTTVAYQENSQIYYALEGSSYIAGAAVQWVRDNLKIIESSSEIENIAKEASLDSMKNIMFLPFFTGLGSPYWVSNTQGAIIGLTRDSAREQICRACLEGIALSINDLIDSIRADSNVEINELRVDGGACMNDLLMNMQSSFSALKVVRPKVIETTAFGAGCAAAIGAGVLTKEDISRTWKEDKSFSSKSDTYYKQKKDQWKESIRRLYL